MANWGAFAGGIGKGYMAADDMYQTRKRTAAIERESELREKANARAEEEQQWRRDQKAREDQFYTASDELFKSMPWQTDADGKVNPLAPENRDTYTIYRGQQLKLMGDHRMLKPNEQLEFDKYMEALKDKETKQTAEKSALAFVASGMNDVKALEPLGKIVGRSFEGYTIEEGKPDQTGFKPRYLKSPEGQYTPLEQVLAILPGGDKVAGEIDRQRKSAIDLHNAETNAAIRRDTAASLAEQRKAAIEDRRDRQNAAKVESILKLNNAISEGVLKVEQDPVTKKVREIDPHYNRAANMMIEERTKDFDPTAKGQANLATQVRKIQTEVKSELDKVDAFLKADIAKAKKAGQAPTPEKIEENKRKAYDMFIANGYKWVDPKREEPAKAEAKPTGTRVQTRGGSYTTDQPTRVYTRGGSYTQ